MHLMIKKIKTPRKSNSCIFKLSVYGKSLY
jgi:hypothetical protein